MSDGRIHIPARKISKKNSQGVIKISEKAFEALIEVVNESGQSVRTIASEIILQAIENNLIIYDREE